MKTSTLLILAVVGVVAGLGAGIGAGYGIFHKDSSSSGRPDWMTVINGSNGTMYISEDGNFNLSVDGLRSKAPAFTDVPYRIATMVDRDTAIDFIDAPLNFTTEGDVNAIVTYKSGNSSGTLLPVSFVSDPIINGAYGNFSGVVHESVDGTQDGKYTGGKKILPMERISMFILAGTAPDSLQLNL